MTYAIWASIVGWFARVFAPHGNLLTSDIVAEVTIHVLSNGQRKTWASKIDSQPVMQQTVESLIGSAVEFAKPNGIVVSWGAVAMGYEQTYPNQAVAEQHVQQHLQAAINLAKPHKVVINWDALKGVDQFRPPEGKK